jgi:hypothetical protein
MEKTLLALLLAMPFIVAAGGNVWAIHHDSFCFPLGRRC